MTQVRGWMAVVFLCCAAGAGHAEEQPDARLQEAQVAHAAAIKLYQAGRYADAIAKNEHALALREALLGLTHPDVARSLDMLGRHYLRLGDTAGAEPLLQRALAIREAAFGETHPEVAGSLHNLASLS